MIGKGPELAIDLVQRTLIGRLTMGGFDLLAPPNALNAKLAYQTLDGASGDINLLALHCMPQLARAVDRPVLRPNILHLLAKIHISLGPIRCPVRITLDGKAFIESRGAICSTRQIGSTLCSARWSFMKAIICGMGGRAPSRCPEGLCGARFREGQNKQMPS